MKCRGHSGLAVEFLKRQGTILSILETALFIWLGVTAAPFLVCCCLGWAGIRVSKALLARSDCDAPILPIEVLVPIKGLLPDQERILETLLTQDYAAYRVMFIVESEEDPVNELVDSLCARYGHARKVISGLAECCGQKNHSLVQGLQHVRQETPCLVFYDASNAAEPQWLSRFTCPLRRGVSQVVTTFRAFRPMPETMWGVAQAMYASFLLLLMANKPKPWGGATGIMRGVLDRVDIIDAWSNNVIDDLTLGNVLERAKIDVFLDPINLLKSPLKNQSLTGFLNYLDRQILFPKFTNPLIWASMTVLYLNLTLAVVVSAVLGIMFPLNLVGPYSGCFSYGFLAFAVVSLILFRQINPFGISLVRWLAACFPFIFATAFVFLRSIFRNYIDWHGIRYWPGKDGVVLALRPISECVSHKRYFQE
jgi:ceramide glucosyltransferase